MDTSWHGKITYKSLTKVFWLISDNSFYKLFQDNYFYDLIISTKITSNSYLLRTFNTNTRNFLFIIHDYFVEKKKHIFQTNQIVIMSH